MALSYRLAVCLFGRFPEWIWATSRLVPGAIERKDVSGQEKKAAGLQKINKDTDQRDTIVIKSPN